MRASSLVLALLVVLLLSMLAYIRLTAKDESTLAVENLPVDSKEFVWVRMDTLSRGLMDISGNEIKVDTTKAKSYTIQYTTKKYLFHETINGIKTNKEHLLKNFKGLMEYKEEENKVEIKLKREDIYVYCPVLILDRILYWRNNHTTK